MPEPPPPSTRPWVAEVEVSPDLARRLIRAQCPGVATETVEPLGAGWDNTAYLVGGTVVFRFPRRALAVPLLEAETRVLPALAPRLPLPVPVPEWVGRPSAEFPWPFAGYRLLAGTPSYRLHPTRAERAAAAAELGNFVRVLHTVDPTGLDLPDDTLERATLADRVGKVRARFEGLGATGALPRVERWLGVLDALGSPRPGPRRTVVHGDLDTRHVLLDARRRPTGVIDWGDLHRGDPALDLTVAYTYLPAPDRASFFAAYGPVPAETARLARLRALHSAACCLEYATAIGDAALVSAYREALEFLLD